MTVDDLAHVIVGLRDRHDDVLDGSATAHVNYSAQGSLAKATDVGLSDNARVVDAFQKAGVDLKPQTCGLVEPRPGQDGDGVLHDHDAGLAGDLAGQRGRRVHDQRHPGDLGLLRRHEPDLGRQRLAERLGLAADRPRRADPLRPGEAVLLLQQGVGRERQHLQGAERLLGPVLRRHQLGRRARARRSRRPRRRRTTTRSTSRPSPRS